MRRLTIKHSAIAYILNREMGYTQNAIAKLMDYDLIEEIVLLQIHLNNLRCYL